MSKLSSAPWWTPPMPPVPNTSMPASWAQIIVAATVVEPGRPVEIANARSARDSFMTPVMLPSLSSVSASRPMRILPSRTAMVAGTAPRLRISASTARAVSTLSG